MDAVVNKINYLGLIELNHVPRVGDHCYSNKFIIYDSSCTSFEFKYMPRGWDGAKSQILINLFSKGRLIIKLPFYIKLFEPKEYKQFETNYTGVYRHMSNLIFNWKGKSYYWGIPFAEVLRKNVEVKKNGEWVSCKAVTWDDKQELIKESKKRFLFHNETRSGEIQETNATVYIERSTWKRKWWPFTFKTRSIQFDFDESVGSDKNSWKGGVCGSSYRMEEGETIEQAWDRFYHEKNYK